MGVEEVKPSNGGYAPPSLASVRANLLHQVSNGLIFLLQVYLTVCKTILRSARILARSILRRAVAEYGPRAKVIVGPVVEQAQVGLTQIRLRLTSLGEMSLAVIFVPGPLFVLGLSYACACIVTVMVYLAKRLGWNHVAAKGLGHDIVAAIFKVYLRLWHGYEIVGMENIPRRGGALIAWYHGPMPVDYFGLIAEVQMQYGRFIHSIIDRCLTSLPMNWMFKENLGCITEGRDGCIKLLQEGQLIGVAPGGARECMFNEEYKLNWSRRIGFASVAVKAGVPVIPMFTENICQAYKKHQTNRDQFLAMYEQSRLPTNPIWGGFPVKLVTHVGEPIMPTPEDTPETFRDKVVRAVEALIAKHQKMPVSVASAMVDRVRSLTKVNTVKANGMGQVSKDENASNRVSAKLSKSFKPNENQPDVVTIV